MHNKLLKKQLDLFHQGDQDAFMKIYDALKTPVYTIIYRILYDHMLAEDVMQDVFLRLYKNASSLHIKNPRAWIFQMARNLAIDYMRKRKDHSSLSAATKQEHNTLEHTVSTKLDIESALQQLPSTDREMVTLHLNGDLKFHEIAKLMDKPLGTVLWRYQKSIRTLRHTLSQNNG